MKGNDKMKKNKSLIISIMSLFFVVMGSGTITAAMANIAAAFPNIPFTTILLISTLPSLLIIPSTLCTGIIAGKKVKYKSLALLGLGLFVISGIAPTFLNSSLSLIIAARVLFGISLGILTPLGNAIVMEMYEGQSRANMLGIGSFVTNLGAIIFQFLGGTLSGISWKYCFLAHSPAIVCFILVLLFLKEPESVQQKGLEGAAKKEKIPAAVWILSVFFGLTMMLFFPMLVNMSSIMSQVKGIGDATQAAFSLSMYTVGGAVSGVLFGKVYKVLRKFVIPVAFIGTAFGLSCVVFGKSLAVITIGTTLSGLFYMLLMLMIIMLIGMYSPASANAMSISIMMAVMSAFTFIATYWIGLIGAVSGDVYIMPIKVAIIAYIIMAVALLVINPFPKSADNHYS